MADFALAGQAIFMIDTTLRHVKERALLPIVARIAPCISPLTLTLLGGAIGLAAAGAAALGWTELGLGLWALNRIFDGLDGTLARFNGTQSDLGGYLDLMTDFLVYVAIPVGLGFDSPSNGVWLALVLMFGSFYVNAGSFLYLSALLERRQHGAKQCGELTAITMPVGLIEGAETVIFYSLFFLFPAYLTTLMTVFGVLVAFSAAQRVVWAARYFRE
jgi:phosphatidylglycerophosphate synthase